MAQQGNTITRRSFAKLNLFLEVLGKRPDGYHEIATVMQRISLYDALAFERADAGIEISCTDPSVPVDERNLVWRAVEAVRVRVGGQWGCRVHIEKHIPAGAGLGGGSSNAATTLVALNELFELGLSLEDLAELAAGIGSDVAFFLNGPAAFCRGRGEIVEPLACPAALHYVLLMPGLHVSTAEVYGRVTGTLTPCHKDATVLTTALLHGDAEELGAQLFNRLQPPAFAMHPKLAQYRATMAELGACGALMSGSGSTLFALCRDARHARTLAAALETKDWGEVLVVVGDTS